MFRPSSTLRPPGGRPLEPLSVIERGTPSPSTAEASPEGRIQGNDTSTNGRRSDTAKLSYDWSDKLTALRLEKVARGSADMGQGFTWGFVGTLRDASRPLSDDGIEGLGQALLFASVNRSSFKSTGKRDLNQWLMIADEAAGRLDDLLQQERAVVKPITAGEKKRQAGDPRVRPKGYVSVRSMEYTPSSDTRAHDLVTGTVVVDESGRYICASGLLSPRSQSKEASGSTDPSDRSDPLQAPATKTQTVGVSFRWTNPPERETADTTTRRPLSALGHPA